MKNEKALKIVIKIVALLIFIIIVKIALNELAKSQMFQDMLQNSEENKNLAKDFTLINLDGEEITLSDLKGQKVYLNFWATWCPPCRLEMPYMNEINNENDDIKIIAISSGESKETVEEFIKENNYEFEVLLDPDGKVANEYKVFSIPLSVLIDEKGSVADTFVGAMTKEEMIEFMRLDTKE